MSWMSSLQILSRRMSPVMHLKVLSSVVLNRLLVIDGCFRSCFNGVTMTLTQVLHMLTSLLKLMYLFLQIVSRDQTLWLLGSFMLALLVFFQVSIVRKMTRL